MTREEERKEAARTYGITNPVCEIDEYGNFNERDIETPAINFEEGAEWADNTLIERAQNFFRTTHHLHKLDGMELRNFIEDFRKAMKE